jgi:hypothetical protein
MTVGIKYFPWNMEESLRSLPFCQLVSIPSKGIFDIGSCEYTCAAAPRKMQPVMIDFFI